MKIISNKQFENATLRIELSSRGGGIEINLTAFGHPNVKMTACQNYLGGGLLGRVMNDCNIRDWENSEKADELLKIGEQLKQYFHNLSNPDTEWESKSYEQNQNMPSSAY
ncbi:MAG: hypothetical protein ACOCWC_04890 [Bacteroidota bacterium]